MPEESKSLSQRWSDFSRSVFFGRAQSKAGLRDGMIDVGETRVGYLKRSGDLETVVMLHGFGAGKEGWMWMARHLPKGLQLVVPDFPGFAPGSKVPLGWANPRGQAQFIVALLDALDIERAHLIGVSMGGTSALRCAQDSPERLLSVMAINPMLPEYHSKRTAEQQGPPFMEFELSIKALQGQLPWLLRTSEHRAEISNEYVRRRMRLQWVFDNWMTALPEELLLLNVPNPPVPLALLYTGRDKSCPMGSTLQLNRILPEAEMMEYRNLGHAPQITDADTLATRWMQFVTRKRKG